MTLVALATEQYAPVLVEVRHGLTTSDLRRPRCSFRIIESGRERESVMVDTADLVLSNLGSIDNIDADRVPSNFRDLPHSIDNIDAAIVHMPAERIRRTYRGDA
jgi:hypothetical protein